MTGRNHALREISQLHHVWIPMHDGTRLAARVWLQADAESVLLQGGQSRFHIVTRGDMTCDARSFVVEDEVSVHEGDAEAEREVIAKKWHFETPRDHAREEAPAAARCGRCTAGR